MQAKIQTLSSEDNSDNYHQPACFFFFKLLTTSLNLHQSLAKDRTFFHHHKYNLVTEKQKRELSKQNQSGGKTDGVAEATMPQACQW